MWVSIVATWLIIDIDVYIVDMWSVRSKQNKLIPNTGNIYKFLTLKYRG